MNHSCQELREAYLMLQREQDADWKALDEWTNSHPSDNTMPPQRNPIVIGSRNMVFLYLSACLCLQDEELSEKFKIHLYAVEAYAKQVFQNQYSVYLFLQIALCGMAPSVEHYLHLFMPDFFMDAKTNEYETFIHYVMKISGRLRQTDYPWYGTMLIESMISALQSGKYFPNIQAEPFIRILQRELKKY